MIEHPKQRTDKRHLSTLNESDFISDDYIRFFSSIALPFVLGYSCGCDFILLKKPKKRRRDGLHRVLGDTKK